MVVIDNKELSTELCSQLYCRNNLFTNYWNKKNKDINVTIKDIDTRLNTLKVKGYRGLYKYGLCVLDRDINLGRGDKKYSNADERKQAHNIQSKESYHNKPERIQFKKDTDKTLLINNKESIVEANKEFYSTHYPTNFFISLQHGFVLDDWDKKVCKTSEDYQSISNQDKYQIVKIYSLDKCLKEALAYIKRLTKNGIPIYDYWYLAIHKSKYDGSYHAHIAINIIDKSIVNVHTYLQNRWYKSQRKKQMVKKIYDQSELIGYMNEEKKRINGDTVYTDCNIDRHSNRIFSQNDINDLGYTMNTFDHPTSQAKLKQFRETA